MDATLNALGQILLQALPTFFLVLLLYVYLRAVFFKPLERVLAERHDRTEGARAKAAESLRRAEAKVTEYEESLRAAKNEIYKEQEDVRRRWRDDQVAQMSRARADAQASVEQAKLELAAQADVAKGSLEANTRALADQITQTILSRRPI